MTSTCIDLTCHYGYCKETDEGPTCICDEGFVGISCNEQGSDFYQRTQLMSGLADPSVLSIGDDLFFLMGTADGLVLPIYQSTDLINFQLNITYDPSASDSAYHYCYVGAPDLVNNGNSFILYFCGQRVSKHLPCSPSRQDVTTFIAQSIGNSFTFGAPELIDFGRGGPKGRIGDGCNDDDCAKTIRIDSDDIGSYNDRWYFYVWFDGGNNIASIPFSNPSNVTINTGPAAFPIFPDEERVNEAPQVFQRNETYYLFFSTANFYSQYAMHYIMSNNIADLTRKRAVRTHSIAERNSAGILVQNHGSNAIVSRRGQFFNVFHQGNFDQTGKMNAVGTFKQRLAFRSDGSIQTLNTVDIRWTRLSSYQYSLDVLVKNGTSIGPCIAVGHIKNASNVIYSGVCLDAADRLIGKIDVVAFRLYYLNDSVWRNFIDVPYDGISDKLDIFLPGGTTEEIVIYWNERITGSQYSLDVRRSDGSWIAPCVGNKLIVSNIEYIFDGNCHTASISVQPQNITSIRMCSAIKDDWSHAVCGTVPYDGKTLHVYVPIF